MQEPDQQQGNPCCPNLDLERVGRSADEGFDPQVLFDALEEELYLPASLVDGGDGGSVQVQMLGSVDELALAFLVLPDHPAEETLIVFGGVLCQYNDLVFSNFSIRRNGPGLNHKNQS